MGFIRDKLETECFSTEKFCYEFKNNFCEQQIAQSMPECRRMTYLLTYVATNIWLRAVQEDLSLTVCLEHSAFNL
jgi:hypothetical protein